ncbi:methyltransferase domain-containing protein [Streptomyces olivoreticuli]|uniref:methyltransferase domain-containing protein n=1 Tax=Streptomyces olivoreticuli TaxID=68246 RepID=UPI00265AFA3D|nr:methyltransferase domain-containing protein [Streptomyces olivoreticuli]WKK26897.1 methyltransferase domain-containing protein [Streptomyces olivoreticuli]
MTDPTLETARPYMAALADELTKAGMIRSPGWAEAFATVPRHVFVPEWYEQETNDKGITVWRRRKADTTDDDLAAVYRNTTLVTALDPDTAKQLDESAWTGVPTSSSTLPSLMAGMLEELSVQDGHRVLEVGTGTGYNTALLSARLGDRAVHSVDIDPDLVHTAERRLSKIGYTPQLATGDGQNGHPDGGPFDRIIATCSVTAIPQGWIEQTKPGAILHTDIALGIDGGLVRLTTDEEHRARGRFTRTTGRFMAARTDARAYPRPNNAPAAPEAGRRPTPVTATDIRTHYPFRLLLAFHLPQAKLVYHRDDVGALSLQLQQRDGSWARAPLTGEGAGIVTYGGALDLWQQVEAAWTWWNNADRPTQDHFEYVREPDGRASVCHTTDGRRWDLAPTS